LKKLANGANWVVLQIDKIGRSSKSMEKTAQPLIFVPPGLKNAQLLAV
jgi:hypothetical protein